MVKDTEKNKKSILIADDDLNFRDSLRYALTHAGYHTETAKDGATAKKLLGEQVFDALISDIKMPGMDGIDLMLLTKATNPDLPVILITSFSKTLSRSGALKMGAADFFLKPFKMNELLLALKKALGEEVIAEQVYNEDTDFRSIPIDDFVYGKSINYPVYVRLSSSKYIKMAHSGNELMADKLKKLRERGITHLFLQVIDHKKYVTANVQLAKTLSKDEVKIDPARKMRFMKSALKAVFDDSFTKDLEPKQFEMASDVVRSTLDVATDSNQLLCLIEGLASLGDHTYAHSVAVSTFSTLIARNLEWNSPENIYRVAMAGLYHDIGKKSLEPEKIIKPLIEMSREDLAEYRKHPVLGVEILSEIENIPEAVLSAIMQHHEREQGTGFPAGSKGPKIHPFAKIIGLADEFCNLIMPRAGMKQYPSSKAMNLLGNVKKDLFDPKVMKAFMKIFGKNS